MSMEDRSSPKIIRKSRPASAAAALQTSPHHAHYSTDVIASNLQRVESRISATSRPHSTPHLHSQSQISDRVPSGWLNVNGVRSLQDRADLDTKETRAMLDKILENENGFVKDLDDYITYKQIIDLRKKEVLHKKWNSEVYSPIRRKIIDVMDGPPYTALEKRKREIHKEFLEFSNKKGHVFLDTFPADEYYPLGLNPIQPLNIKAETRHLRDPLLSQGRARNEEERNILRCETGTVYKDKDIETIALPPTPLVPLGRHGTECSTWMAMPIHDIESPVRHASRRRMLGKFNNCDISVDPWGSCQNQRIVEREMALQKKRRFPLFEHNKQRAIRRVQIKPNTPLREFEMDETVAGPDEFSTNIQPPQEILAS